MSSEFYVVSTNVTL